MRLRSLALRNYRRFRDVALEFPEGLIGVVGRNGAGKSTLLEAILWSLFGHDAARTSKDLLKRQGAAPGEDVVVRLEFSLDGTSMAVTRRLRGKTLQPEAAIEADGQLLVAPGANSWDQANRFLGRVFGMDRAAFEATVVTRQGELSALSELRPGDRKRLLLGLLGVDRIEGAIQASRQDAREVEIRLSEIRRGLEDEPALRARLSQAEAERDRALQEVDALGLQVGEATQAAQAARALADSLLERRNRDRELRVRLESLQGSLEGIWTRRTRVAAEGRLLREQQGEGLRLRSELVPLTEIDAALLASEEVRLASERRGAAHRALNSIEGSLARWKALAEAPGIDHPGLDALESKSLRLRRLLEADREGSTQLAAEGLLAAQNLSQAESSVSEIRLADATLGPDEACPTCQRPLGEGWTHWHDERIKLLGAREREARDLRLLAQDLERRRTDLGVRLREHETALAANAAEIQRVRAGLERAQLARTEWDRLEAERLRAADELAQLAGPDWDEPRHRELLGLRERRDRLRDRIAALDAAAMRLEAVEREDRVLRGEEEDVQRARETASRELGDLSYGAGSWEKARGEADVSGRRLESLRRDLVQWKERRLARCADAERLRAEAEAFEARRQDADTLALRLQLLETLTARRADQGLLPEFKTHVIGRIRPVLARAASGLLAQMTEGRYVEVALDDDYGGRLYDGGLAHPLERFSGGEVDVANLALRLAVSELVTNARGRARLNLVALDEIFGSQDEGRRRAVLDSLRGLARVFQQVLVVTHLEDVRDRLDHVVRICDAGDGTSRLEVSWEDKP